MSFTSPVDIANRACQHLGARRISSLTDSSKQAAEINFCYDKLRVAELRRSTWAFATRRATLYSFATTSLRYIPSVWSSGTTYSASQIVQDSNGVYWISPFNNNIGNTPGTPITGRPAYWQQYFGPVIAPVWSGTVTYNAGDLVCDATPYFYISNENNNLNHTPSSGSPWVKDTNSPLDTSIPLLEPVGPSMSIPNTGGSPSSFARNLFPLPNGYLRPLAPDPKVASASNLQTSGALLFNDYQFEGGYIVSAGAGPILFRFVADISDVTAMDALFCELLAARIAMEICEIITQSPGKMQEITASYQALSKDARLVNWIETGNTEPQEDTYEAMMLTKGIGTPARGQ